MIFKYFSVLGYLSVVLWIAVPVLWYMHAKRRPRGWFCHWALVAAVAAYILAALNSEFHVNRIQIDRSEEIAEAQARMEKARQAALEARGDEVAEVRFAEDDANDFLDQGGMDDADRKYMDTFTEDAAPEWKKEKKKRSKVAEDDTSLEGMLDTSEKEESVDADVVEEKSREPIMMPEVHMMAANKLDSINLKLIRLLIFIGLGYVVVDYLKRLNIYEDSYCPLPVPSSWANGLTPLPPVRSLPEKKRRSMAEELEEIVRRGDSFLYLSDNSEISEKLPDKIYKVKKPKLAPVDIIRVTADDPIASSFIFETLWYGRSSFIVDSYDRSVDLLGALIELMAERRATRAAVKENVHIVWDLDVPLEEGWLKEFEKMLNATGISLIMR